MRSLQTLLAILCVVPALLAQDAPRGPSDEKAQKTYQHALAAEHAHDRSQALENFKKADKQDGGHCRACQEKMVEGGLATQDWNLAETAAGEMVAEAQGPKEIALAHCQLGAVWMREALAKHKPEIYARSHEEFSKALASAPNFPEALYGDAFMLAQMNQDDAATAQFEKFVKLRTENDPQRQRALRFIRNPELARARLAPPFAVTTIDGQRMSLDDLLGKVVLIDFWATWCVPCREALPQMRKIAANFKGQPLVVLSISVDTDEQKWKDFVAQHQMTWPQYRDQGFNGSMATLFDVHAIPHTFTIDADGILQDEKIGDASEGKLKKLVARAQQAGPVAGR